VSNEGNASVRQLELPLEAPGDEAVTGTRGEDAPVEGTDLLERVLEAENLRRALYQVRRNQGAPGVDGMTVDDLGAYLKIHWPTTRAALLAGTYVPQPVRRTELPKPGGGTRHLGIPTVLDRFIEQALWQGLQKEWDPTFSEGSYGVRPKRSAHQAMGQAQAYIQAGYTRVVDIDLEKFFDRVNHDVLLSRVRRRVQDRRVLSLIHRFLKAGVLTLEGSVEPTVEGTPQGGPLTLPTKLSTGWERSRQACRGRPCVPGRVTAFGGTPPGGAVVSSPTGEGARRWSGHVENHPPARRLRSAACLTRAGSALPG
jgi:RNA-directed DNA polymerase